MRVSDKPLDQVTEADLQALVQNEVKEGRDIEYKECLPGRTEGERKEFLADVSSFANASGGDLLYGCREKRDESNQQTGLPESFPGIGVANVAAEQQRLEQILQSGIDLRIPGVAFHSVVMADDAIVLLIRVPRSWIGPHMVTFQDWCRFYSRNSSGKYLLDVGELRRAFLGAEAPSRYVRSWQAERLGRIIAGETPVLLPPGPRIVLHIIPLAMMDPAATHDLSPAVQDPSKLPPIGSGGWNNRVNLDGFVTFGGPLQDGTSINYTQLFRTGAVEALTTASMDTERRRLFPFYEDTLIRASGSYLGVARLLEVAPPLVVMVSLLGVKGYAMRLSPKYSTAMFGGIDRDTVVGPEALIDDLAVDLTHALRPCFDAVWNACGYPRSGNYTADGAWRGMG